MRGTLPATISRAFPVTGTFGLHNRRNGSALRRRFPARTAHHAKTRQVPQAPLRCLPQRPRRPFGRRALPGGTRNALRGVPAPLLATRLCRSGTRGPSAGHPDPRRGPGGVPRRRWAHRGAGTALRAPGHLARVRQGAGARHPLLLPRLALRRRRHHPRHPRGAPRQLNPSQALPGRLSGRGVAGPGVRLHGSAGGVPALPRLRRLRAFRGRGRPASTPLPVQLAPGQRERDRPDPPQLPAHPPVRGAVRAGVRQRSPPWSGWRLRPA